MLTLGEQEENYKVRKQKKSGVLFYHSEEGRSEKDKLVSKRSLTVQCKVVKH